MSQPSVAARILDVLLHQPGPRDPEIRAASLLTLNESDPLSIAALSFTQLGWLCALSVSGWPWIAGFMLLDAALFAHRWRMRRAPAPPGPSSDRATELAFASVNLGLTTLVTCCVLLLTQVGSDRASILAIILTIGFSSYSAGLFTAFKVLASINIGMLTAAMGVGLALGPSDLARPFAWLALPGAISFRLLIQRTHQAFLQAIRSQRDHRRLSLQDPLTRLPNRTRMRDLLAEGIACLGAAGAPRRMAVLCLDLDGFKRVNDRHGHAAGDAVLVRVAGLLGRCVAAGDAACRTGGDEFVVLLPGADETCAGAVGAAIIEAVSVPFEIGPALRARIGVSIGAVVVRDPRRSLEAVLEAADGALYAAKRAGRNRLRFGSPDGTDPAPAPTDVPAAAPGARAGARRTDLRDA